MIPLKQWAVWCGIVALSVAGQLGAADIPPHTCTRDVVYGRKVGLALTMDVFQPKNRANGAAILSLRSGDYMSGEQPFSAEAAAEFLDRGFTVFAVCHGSTPAFPVDEIASDIHRAVRYVRRHAKDYGIDPGRLAIFGVSSGGHLAAHVGVSGGAGPPFPRPDFSGVGRYDPIEVEETSKVAAFVSVCGLSDLVNYEAEGKSILEFRLPPEIRKKAAIDHVTAPFEFRDYHRNTNSFFRVTNPAEIKRRLQELSPLSLVSANSAPGLLIHGDRDENVPVRQAEALAGRLRAAGVPVELVIRKGVGHGVYRWREDNKMVADWLDKQLTQSR
jgi:acetyl esterase/lipase